MPKSLLGKLGFFLMLLFVVVLTLKITVALSVPSLAIVAGGLLGSVLSTIAYFKGDRANAMLLTSGLVGGFVLFLIALEFANPS